MPLKYSKAPISELICGFILNSNLLLTEGILFKVIGELTKEYSTILTHPTIFEEEVVNDTIQGAQDYAKAGFATYRLMTADGRWNVLLQQNLLTFHWIRQDVEDVGNYPGFVNVFEKFKEIFLFIRSLYSDAQVFDSQIKSYYLSYGDRVNLEEYKSQGLSIPDIINLNPPVFEAKGKKYFANNYFCKYSIPCDVIYGYSIVSINTPTLPGIGQLLAVDNKIKGYSSSVTIDDWFRVAHDLQVSFFESLFNEHVLRKWK